MTHSVNVAVIDWPASQTALAAAVQAAQAMGVRVNVALVDASGVLAGFMRMPGAPLHSIDIAIDKAYTSASFGLPTARWTEVLQSHSVAVREGLVQRPRFVAFGGGVPIVEDGRCIGAIGVSGGSEQQDEQIARAGLEALGLAQD
ncbi:GlcG/HbpS family heme-binding protein [Hydrogenophaga palleronii]|uniref:GlcG/HbpS family heme-binding protein n=1 Tax=Hydrogenophaga palleronii TaxID=65655 RepID=UPI000824D662|nr:heme-binding protein [Hydrogenophaga palleronii]